METFFSPKRFLLIIVLVIYMRVSPLASCYSRQCGAFLSKRSKWSVSKKDDAFGNKMKCLYPQNCQIHHTVQQFFHFFFSCHSLLHYGSSGWFGHWFNCMLTNVMWFIFKKCNVKCEVSIHRPVTEPAMDMVIMIIITCKPNIP